ncbi:MAG: hypothetical protein IKU60_05690 [Clostridia bacterium]|nr:hypothetical protein [Clostridia bacterium]
MPYFAVIDTETNWKNELMSIGTVIADCETFKPVKVRYHIITPEYKVGGMFSDVLFDERLKHILCPKDDAIIDLVYLLKEYEVGSIFAYNAPFDRTLLPQLRCFDWYDIVRVAAYRQYNPKITELDECCKTGRLKHDYGVEAMLRRMSGDFTYSETHNALYDALDELEIMRLLGYKPEIYTKMK